jgi:GNAT superfamily N-acetyltransferase
VKPSAQGQGVGTALLQHVNSLVDTDNTPAGPSPIYLDASKAGQQLYLKMGYEFYGDRARDFPGMIRWGKCKMPRPEE